MVIVFVVLAHHSADIVKLVYQRALPVSAWLFDNWQLAGIKTALRRWVPPEGANHLERGSLYEQQGTGPYQQPMLDVLGEGETV